MTKQIKLSEPNEMQMSEPVKIVNCGAKMSYVSYVRMRVTDFNCCTAERQSSLRRKSDHQSVTAGIKWSEKAREREREWEWECV